MGASRFQMMAYARDQDEEDEEDQGRRRGEVSGRWKKAQLSSSSELFKSEPQNNEHSKRAQDRWKRAPQPQSSSDLLSNAGELRQKVSSSSRWSRAQTISSAELHGAHETSAQNSGGGSSRWKKIQQSSADLVKKDEGGGREEKRREDGRREEGGSRKSSGNSELEMMAGVGGERSRRNSTEVQLPATRSTSIFFKEICEFLKPDKNLVSDQSSRLMIAPSVIALRVPEAELGNPKN